MVKFWDKRVLGIAIVVLAASAISFAYVLLSPSLYPVPCSLDETFGTNLGFETGNLDGWTNPRGLWEVLSNVTRSGKYAAYAYRSSKFTAEIYQNWKTNPALEIYLEAYVLVTCPMEAGIVLREIDSVELYAETCPTYPPLQGQDHVLARVRIKDVYTGSYVKYPFTHSQWYKLGVTVQSGRIGYYVNEKLIHVENRTVTFSNPSFGAKVGVYSATYFDDFRMGQRNPSIMTSPLGVSWFYYVRGSIQILDMKGWLILKSIFFHAQTISNARMWKDKTFKGECWTDTFQRL